MRNHQCIFVSHDKSIVQAQNRTPGTDPTSPGLRFWRCNLGTFGVFEARYSISRCSESTELQDVPSSGVGAHHVSHPWRGCVLALAWATCAATTALSLEVLLTNRTQTQPTAGIDQSVLVQSVVLLSFTSLVSLTWWAVDVTYYNEPKYMFHGWDGGTWAIATFMVRGCFWTLLTSG